MFFIIQGPTLLAPATGLVLEVCIHMHMHTIYCKSFEVDKFHSFCGLIGNCGSFQCNSLYTRKQDFDQGFGHIRLPSNHECFPANYSLVLQLRP